MFRLWRSALFGDPPLCATARAKVGHPEELLRRFEITRVRYVSPVSRISCQTKQRRKPMRSSSAAMLHALEILPSLFPFLSRSRTRFRPEQGSSSDIAIGNRILGKAAYRRGFARSQLHTRQSRNAVIICAAYRAVPPTWRANCVRGGEPLEAISQAILDRIKRLPAAQRTPRGNPPRFNGNALEGIFAPQLSRSASSAKPT